MQREFKANTLDEAIHQATHHIEGHKMPAISHKGWSTMQFVRHHYVGRGRTVYLNNIGLLGAVKREANRLAINRSGGFKDQIRDQVKRVKNGRVSISFNNSYNFGKVRFFLRGGTLHGVFGGQSKQVGNILLFTGEITILYTGSSEDFASLVDIRRRLFNTTTNPPEWLREASKSGGKVYAIKGSWNEKFAGKIAL